MIMDDFRNFMTRATAAVVAVLCMFLSFTGLQSKAEKETIFIGHRGYSSQHVDNTEESFVAAAQKGYSGCETDVRVTSDGVLVLSHDDNQYFEDGTELSVADHTYAELSAVPLANKYNKNKIYICTFKRYLEVMRDNGMFCFIELKGAWSDESLNKLYAEVVENYSLDDVSVQSGGFYNLDRLHELHDDIAIMYCAGGFDDENVQRALDSNYDVDLQMYHFDPEVIKQFHDKGLRVAVWTCNLRMEVAYCLYYGVDFIESDTRSSLTPAIFTP